MLLAGSRFEVSGRHADVLLRTLPPVIHLKAEGDQVALHWSSELMMQELREGRPGASLVAQHLAHLMLAQTLRLYLSQQSGVEIGWFTGLAGPQEGAVIRAIHADPGHGWTLEDLWHIQACHEPLLHDVSAKKRERRRSHTLRAGE